MYDELTEVDIKKMREEIDHRANVLRPKYLEEVKRTRAFGDLSENFEYHEAKRDRNKNESRIHYLERMIATAKVVSAKSDAGTVGLFDTVELFLEEEGETQKIRLVTTLRQNVLEGRISPKSPVGKAIMGKSVGDRVFIEVSPEYSFHAVIRSVEKGTDDESLPISRY